MNLTRLQELTATSKMIAEGKATKDFDGIRAIVEDALGDLHDKIGKGGSLSDLMKSSGASKLDTVKDADGKNILAQITTKTAEFKKSIEKLLMEAEMLVMQLDEGMIAEGMIAEASGDYGDSADFTEEFYDMHGQVIKLKSKMKNPRWMKWMKVTDNNFGTDTTSPAEEAITAVNQLDAAFSEIESELDKAM